MFGIVLKMLAFVAKALLFLSIPVAVFFGIFALLCLSWYLIFRFYFKMEFKPSGVHPPKSRGIIKQLIFDVPKRYVLDIQQREPGFFKPKGIHMFCGEQGSGKTIAAVELMTRLQKTYPESKCLSNFGLASEDDELSDWHQLLDYTNGHKGVIVGIDEIQNWFQSGKVQLPEGMLEIVTQNRKNCRILVCTSQVFTRVNKGLREQVTLVYNPRTFFGCFTVVTRYKPMFDSEGNVISMKWKGLYAFTHTEELRNAYDTYKVIHTLSKDGFKDPLPEFNTNIRVVSGKRK